ncbi:hypothetical protein F4818DRAFT_446528 [Hypoxylon cercidicola]|nr:hypothetical protein F4818DRAFT_446528 [Hypoxylon cercidicola]
MQLTNILLLVALAATTAHANFYTEKGGSRRRTGTKRTCSACHGAFSGSCAGKGTNNAHHSYCVKAATPTLMYGDRTQGYVFEVTHVSDGDRTITSAECYDGHRKEIDGCDYGGSSKYDNWQYKCERRSNG